MPMLGKPTVVTVLPNFTGRLVASGNAANSPSALSNARSLAASTFTTLAEINPALVTKRICAGSLNKCSFVSKNPSYEVKSVCAGKRKGDQNSFVLTGKRQ